MTTNKYFSQGARSEQLLYEDLIIESLKMYGQDVYYMPRELINIDDIFKDESTSRFDNAYKIEMYIENVEGFDGEGDLFAKFGVEIRDAATFIVARKRFLSQIGQYENDPDDPKKQYFRPHEGDLIFLPLSGSIFEIQKVFDENPFYQLRNLPVFRLSCELFEYSGEDFDTDISVIDNVEIFDYQYKMTFNDVENTLGAFDQQGSFQVGEQVSQLASGGWTLTADVTDYNAADSDSRILSVAHLTSTDGLFHSFNTVDTVIGSITGAAGVPLSITDAVDGANSSAQNDIFETESDSLLDFSESNPFGDP
jgi:hypothetical protein